MPHRFSLPRFLLPLALAPALLAQGAGPFQPRVAAVDVVMERFYRGESLEAAGRRVNALVDRFNAKVKARNEELDGLHAEADQALAPARDLEATLKAQDRALGSPPPASDQEAVRQYNERVKTRNALAAQYNQVSEKARQVVEAYNARARTLDAAIAQDQAQVAAQQKALRARTEAFKGFRDQGRDVAFFTGLNRLLADLRAACRTRPDPGLLAALEHVRACRRELAAWAEEGESGQDNGLVLVEALVGDEPCCFIVDTGAQLVCLPVELVDALGLTSRLGEEAPLTLAGGQKVRGRAITLPRVAAAGMTLDDVAGSAVPASEVGIDGLLGQSFLKRFVYIVDERKPGKLILIPR
ncbi:MAG: retropepsin-like aspartic protease [Holophaga sp.]|jgi:clan AA aspartic protease (TIGR02281 family)